MNFGGKNAHFAGLYNGFIGSFSGGLGEGEILYFEVLVLLGERPDKVYQLIFIGLC